MSDACVHCDEPADWGVPYETESGDLVHEHCRESYEQNENEHAYESWLSDYYGGDVMTQDDYYMAAAMERREHDRV